MKKLFFPLLLVLAASLPAPVLAQSAAAPTAGHIQYEVTQKVDLSQVRIMINGQQVKPGSPDFPTDIPDVRTFGMTLAFAGGYAREERESSMMRVVREDGPGGPGGRSGGGGAPQVTRLNPPFKEATYVNLAERKVASTLTVQKDQQTTTYRADQPYQTPASWKPAGQTKKIAGYSCHKATATHKGQTYTIWYTTDLPFTYSPIKELVPAQGVVLLAESEQEQFRATRVDNKPVAAADVQPDGQAKEVSAAELKDLREKAMADFRMRSMEQGQGPGGRE